MPKNRSGILMGGGGGGAGPARSHKQLNCHVTRCWCIQVSAAYRPPMINAIYSDFYHVHITHGRYVLATETMFPKMLLDGLDESHGHFTCLNVIWVCQL